jgi:hypothetical protein
LVSAWHSPGSTKQKSMHDHHFRANPYFLNPSEPSRLTELGTLAAEFLDKAPVILILPLPISVAFLSLFV